MADLGETTTPMETANNSSGSDSSGDEKEVPQIEWLATSRAKRSTAGNRIANLIQQEAEDDELELLFAEDENDEGFEMEKADDSDMQMDSSDDDDDQGPVAPGTEDLEGEKDLQQKERAERMAKKRKGNDHLPKAFQAKKAKINPTAPKRTPPRPKKKSERASWIPTADDAPIRASDRRTTKKSKEQLYTQMEEREKRRLRQLENMEKAAARKAAMKRPEKTQEDRLAEAARIEKRNAKSLNRWEESEKIREEEAAARLAALHNRKMEGPVLTYWSGRATYEGDKLRQVGKTVVVEEKEKPKKKKASEAGLSLEMRPPSQPMPVPSLANGPVSAPSSGIATPLQATVANGSALIIAAGTPSAAPQVSMGPLQTTPDISNSLGKNTGLAALDFGELETNHVKLLAETESAAPLAGLPAPAAAPTSAPVSPLPPSQSPSVSSSAASAPINHVQRPSAPSPTPAMTATSDPGSATPLAASTPTISPYLATPQTTPQSPSLPPPQPSLKSPSPLEQLEPAVLSGSNQPQAAPLPNASVPPMQNLQSSSSQPLIPPQPHIAQSLSVPQGAQPSLQPQVMAAGSLPSQQSAPLSVSQPPMPIQVQKPVQTTPFSSTSSSAQNIPAHYIKPPLALPVTHASTTRIILSSFNDNAMRDKSTINAVLFEGNRFTKIPRPTAPVLCAITGAPAKFKDPKTGLPFLNSYAYKEIRRLEKGEYRWSKLLGAYVGGAPISNPANPQAVLPKLVAARGVPARFIDPKAPGPVRDVKKEASATPAPGPSAPLPSGTPMAPPPTPIPMMSTYSVRPVF